MTDIAVFKTLSEINVNERTEKKNKLTYLSWAWAWAEASKAFPDISYEVIKFEGRPYLADPDLGYMIETSVTIGNKTLPMHLPVMDGANKAMKAQGYKYKTKFGEKSVEQASMFDINKTIMRCLVKNLAMFGLGLYIYAGEDLPDVPPEPVEPVDPAIDEAINTNNASWVKAQYNPGVIADNWPRLSAQQVDKIHVLLNQQ